MRHEHDAGEQTAKTFHQNLDLLLQARGNPQDVMQSGRKYIVWLRNHLLDENGRLFPMVERGLDPETQQAVLRALEELRIESSARVAEGQTLHRTRVVCDAERIQARQANPALPGCCGCFPRWGNSFTVRLCALT